MKKLLAILTITALMASCGDGETTSTETTTDSTSTEMTNDAMSSDTSMNRMDNTVTDTGRMTMDTTSKMSATDSAR